MKVVLINPSPKAIVEMADVPDYPHLGLGYLSAWLEQNDIRCQVIDAKLERLNLPSLMKRLEIAKDDIVGLTAMTHEIKQAHAVAVRLKRRLANVVTVIGGVHVTALPVRTLKEFPAFDYGIFGEGERTLLDLVTAIDTGKGEIKKIKGLVFRVGEDIVQNQEREPIENLDELPFPAWQLFPGSPRYHMITARGCPFQCIFCMRAHGSKLRQRSADNVVSEIEEIITKFKPRRIEVSDETFGADRRRVFRILDLMIEKELNKKIRWGVSTRVDMVDYHLLTRMKEAGCSTIAYGIESGNPEILKLTKKNITLDRAEKIVKLTKSLGIKVEAFFLIGLPFETRDTVTDTINFAVRLNPDVLYLGIVTPFPKTEIYEMARRGMGNYRLLSEDWDDYGKHLGKALELRHLTRKQLEIFQALGYLKMYLYNLRIIGLLKFLYQYRKGILRFLRKYLTAYVFKQEKSEWRRRDSKNFSNSSHL